MVPGSIPGHHTTTIYHYCWKRHPRSAATIEHRLTTPFVDIDAPPNTHIDTHIYTYMHMDLCLPPPPPIILHVALTCRRDTLERVTRVRRLMHRYQVHASHGGDGRERARDSRHRCVHVHCARVDIVGGCECFTCVLSLTPVKWMDE